MGTTEDFRSEEKAKTTHARNKSRKDVNEKYRGSVKVSLAIWSSDPVVQGSPTTGLQTGTGLQAGRHWAAEPTKLQKGACLCGARTFTLALCLGFPALHIPSQPF